jgi:hypothetical protein
MGREIVAESECEMDPDRLFGHVNDSIRRLATEGPLTETWEFICECSDVRCHEMVSLTLLEFDEHRAASPPAPVLAEHGKALNS